MITFYLKWTFKEYKEQLLIGLRRIYLMVHHNVLLMILCWESVHLNAGYRSAYLFFGGAYTQKEVWVSKPARLIFEGKFTSQNRLD